MPKRLSNAQRERFLSGRHVAVLVTIGTDGRPVPTPIWYLYRDGLFYLRTAADAAKVENIRRDGRVSICIQDERAPYRAVVVHGTAEVREGLDWLAVEMPRHYLGLIGSIGYRITARRAIEQDPDVALVVRPERVASFDYAAETPLVGRVWLLLRRMLPPWL